MSDEKLTWVREGADPSKSENLLENDQKLPPDHREAHRRARIETENARNAR
jgi:hypothetical protein